MSVVREVFRAVVPRPLRDLRWHLKNASQVRHIANLPLEAKFDEIYRRNYWGKNADGSMSSGLGSRPGPEVDAYFTAVTKFLSGFPAKLNLVDVGCGDFQVGQRIRPYVAAYTACDISAVIIQQNERKYPNDGVSFLQLNAVEENLPAGDVLTIREVLQHLSNAEVSQILPKLGSFRYVIDTEAIPAGDFTPNADHSTGFSTRAIESHSGIDLAAKPFELQFKSRQVICEVPQENGLVRTTLYEM